MKIFLRAAVLFVMGAGVVRGESLKEAVRGRFLVGMAVTSRELADPKMGALIGGQVDCLTAEVEMKSKGTEMEKGEFTFEGGDKVVAFAQEHKMKVVGHNLVWHLSLPGWMYVDASGKPLSREAALANMKEHIDGVVGHYKGRVIGWDVVNEAISDKKEEYLRADAPAMKAIGPDYLVKAYEFAHAADPGAEMYYNDYGTEQPVKLAKNIRLLRELKAAGVKIDAVGIQSHFVLGNKNTPGELDKAIAAFEAEGVKVMISELDVDVVPRVTKGADLTAKEKAGSDPFVAGLPAKVGKELADYYAAVFRVVLKHPGEVTRVTFWNVDDGNSWLNGWPTKRVNYPLLWDRALKEKEAYWAVIKVLEGK